MTAAGILPDTGRVWLSYTHHLLLLFACAGAKANAEPETRIALSRIGSKPVSGAAIERHVWAASGG